MLCSGDSLLDDPKAKVQGKKIRKKIKSSCDELSTKSRKTGKVKSSENISDENEQKKKKKSKKKQKQIADKLPDFEVNKRLLEYPVEKDRQVSSKSIQKGEGSVQRKRKAIITNYDDIDLDTWEDDDDSIFDLSEDEMENRMEDMQEENTAHKEAITSKKKHLDDFSARLGLTREDFVKFEEKTAKGNDSVLEQVITKAGKPKRKLEVIVFEDPAKRKQKVCNLLSLRDIKMTFQHFSWALNE